MPEAKTRYSKQRETIYEVLKKDESHPNVDSIYMNVRNIIPDISLGTVYRNLNLLADQGRINRLDIGDGVVHFDALTTPHFHFVCDECGTVEDMFLSEDDVDQFINELNAKNGHQINSLDIIFHGTCQGCLRKKS